MAEGAPLLREYVGKTCIEGSNPSGSAKTSKTGPRGPSCFFGVHIPQRSAAVCTGASHSANVSASAAVTVIEQPAISSEVT